MSIKPYILADDYITKDFTAFVNTTILTQIVGCMFQTAADLKLIANSFNLSTGKVEGDTLIK